MLCTINPFIRLLVDFVPLYYRIAIDNNNLIVSILKHYGCTFECERDRNEDFMRAYREQIACRDMIDLHEVFRCLVEMPSKRFWVSGERAAIVMAQMMCRDDPYSALKNMRPMKQEMFAEIYRRTMDMMECYPKMRMINAVDRVVQQPAPKFYITPDSAKVIYYKIRKRWFDKKFARLQHLC